MLLCCYPAKHVGMSDVSAMVCSSWAAHVGMSTVFEVRVCPLGGAGGHE